MSGFTRLIIGGVFIFIGILLCFLPGPGLLLILLGVSLIVGKRPNVLLKEILRYFKERRKILKKGLLFILIFALAGCAPLLRRADLHSERSVRSYKIAIQKYRDLLKISEDKEEIQQKLGRLYYLHGDYELAIKELFGLSDFYSQKLLAISYFKIQDFTTALSIFSQYDDLIDPEYLYYYGLTCERLNLYERAKNLYNRIEDKKYSVFAQERLEAIKPRLEERLDPFIQSLIEESLLKDYPEAGAVILLCDEKIELKLDNTLESDIHFIVRILNERGKKDFSEVEIDYDSTYEKVEIIYAKTIKPDGEAVFAGDKDIRDVSKYLNFPLYSNARVKIVSMPEVSIGSVIEYKAKIKRTELINKKDLILKYRLQEREPVLKANFEIIVPQDREIYTKIINEEYNRFQAELSPKIFKRDTKKIYRYEFRDIPQITPESNLPPFTQINTIIKFSTFKSWDEIYQWWWNLAKDKVGSDENIKRKVSELTENKTSLREMVRAIYNFVAQDIRYVAVAYGQAGYTPHKATDIFMNKYGDCKDKTILLISMLNEIGVEAYPVLIGTEDYYNLEEDFPTLVFNHCIAAVKIGDQIQFVDPTCEVCSFDNLPRDDQERKVLLFGEEGYEILQTPLYFPTQNSVEYQMKIKVDENEEVFGERVVKTYGEFDQGQRLWLKYTPPKLIEESLKKKVSNFCVEADLLSYEIENLKDLDKNITLRYNFKGKDYFTRAGNLRVLPVYAKIDTSLVATKERVYPLDLGLPEQIKEEIEIEIPSHFKVKYIPLSVKEESEWMDFNVEYELKENKIYFRKTQTTKKRRILESEYSQFKEFIERLAFLVNERIVLEVE